MTTPSLQGKTCIVTGGASGLGKAISKILLAAGANTVIVDINASALSSTASELVSSGELHTINTDITSEDAVKSLVEETVSKYGKLDVLVNNAGVIDRFDPVGDVEKGLWDKVIAINLTAPYLLSKAAVNTMVKSGGGSIVNVGSAAGARGGAAGAAYTASKHGLMGLTKSTAAHYTKKGIRCNIILPGGMQTNVMAGIAPESINQAGMGVLYSTMAMKPDMSDVDEMARLVLFLASDDSIVVNGAVIAADKGWCAA